MSEFSYNDIFARATLALGTAAQEELRRINVCIFGVGGVGSWCAEALVRSGVEHLTLVDFDLVSVSNINRQREATVLSVGKSKVEELKAILLQINPCASIKALAKEFNATSAPEFRLDRFDYIIDAIDSLKDKAELICCATASRATFFSSMGAARKVDPRRIKVGNFWKVRDCPLGAALRKKLRQSGRLPEHSFQCVYGDELIGEQKGSLVHITAIFGMTLAGLVVDSVYRKSSGEPTSEPQACDQP